MNSALFLQEFPASFIGIPGMSGVGPTPQEVEDLKRAAQKAQQLTQDYLERCSKAKTRYQREVVQYISLHELLIPAWNLCQKQLQVSEFSVSYLALDCGRI